MQDETCSDIYNRKRSFTTFIFYCICYLKGTNTTFLLFEMARQSSLSRMPLETRKSILISQVVSIFKRVLCILLFGLIAKAIPIEKSRSAEKPLYRGQRVSCDPSPCFQQVKSIFGLPRGQWTSHTSRTNLLLLLYGLKVLPFFSVFSENLILFQNHITSLIYSKNVKKLKIRDHFSAKFFRQSLFLIEFLESHDQWSGPISFSLALLKGQNNRGQSFQNYPVFDKVKIATRNLKIATRQLFELR